MRAVVICSYVILVIKKIWQVPYESNQNKKKQEKGENCKFKFIKASITGGIVMYLT